MIDPDRIDDWVDDSIDTAIRVYRDPFMWVLLVIIFLAVLSIYWAIEEERRWDQFKEDYNCRVVEFKKGTTSIGMTTTTSADGNIGMGPVIVSSPNQFAWKCNDGITYWR